MHGQQHIKLFCEFRIDSKLHFRSFYFYISPYIIWRRSPVKDSAADVRRVKETPDVPVLLLRQDEATIHLVMR
jgi:hypothetical protein